MSLLLQLFKETANRRLAVIGTGLAGLIAALFLAPSGDAATASFPESWNLGLRGAVDDFQSWVIDHRATHVLFARLFDPLSDAIEGTLILVEDFLLWQPWLLVIAAVSLVGYGLGGVGLVGVCAGGFLFMGVVGLWEASMKTLALMLVAVFITLAIGIPTGVLAARSDRTDRILRPILDAMQTVPAFVYLIPVLLFFGVARVPSVVATIIYALPPVIRLTNLGIRQVASDAVEAAQIFGSTKWQMLVKVQLPLALPSILTGINQAIMMALSIVVIAALIGAGGLGREVLLSLQRLQVGAGFEAGMCIVFLAIILDRLSGALGALVLRGRARSAERNTSWHGHDGGHEPAPSLIDRLVWAPADAVSALVARLGPGVELSPLRARLRRHAYAIDCAIVIVLFSAFDLVFPLGPFPEWLQVDFASPVDAMVQWMRDHLYRIGDLPIGTGPFSDFLTLHVLNPLRDFLRETLPWPAVVWGVMMLAWLAGGWRLAVGAGLGMVLPGLVGMWPQSMDTLSQVVIAVTVTVALAIPLGVAVARYRRFAVAMRPILDTLQTIPSFVYLVPVIMLFSVGRVPGLIASVLYAIVPGIKLTALGIKQVPSSAVEAARAFGATPWQRLTRVDIPLAMPTILLGVNQVIMMVLAMVVIAGLVGGAGLGLEVVTGLARNQTGRGVEAGLAIAALAIVLDRITQAWASAQTPQR
ncbi:MAG: ABC transporter permease subunit [Proteobacteria bacterium]|nr:ABC transporter permease subunit [Pseudomonadota bacterium]